MKLNFLISARNNPLGVHHNEFAIWGKLRVPHYKEIQCDAFMKAYHASPCKILHHVPVKDITNTAMVSSNTE